MLKQKASPTWLIAVAFLLPWGLLIKALSLYWETNPQYNYGWLVPPLCIYMALERWRTRPLPSTPAASSVKWVLCLLAFLLLPTWLIEQPNPNWRMVSWALGIEATGMTLCGLYLLGGKNWVRHFAFPACFILTAVPWPFYVEWYTIQGLMHGVAGLTVGILNVFGIPAVQEGNIIEVSSGMLGVDEACSGVRSLQASIMAALFIGELNRLTRSNRVYLLVAGVMFALICNVGRALLLSFIAVYRGMGAISYWHDPAGFTILTLCLALLSVLGYFTGPGQPRIAPKKREVNVPLPIPAMLVAGVAGWAVFSIAATEFWYRSHRGESQPRWTIRWPETRPSFREIPVPENTREILDYDSGRQAVWNEENGPEWTAFFFRWNAGGSRAQLLAREHRPEICLTASGFKLESDMGTKTIETNHIAIPFRVYTFEKNGQPVYVFFVVWQDEREGEKPEKQMNAWNRFSGISLVLQGRRNIGQQVLEIALTGYPDIEAAEAALRGEIDQLITH